MSNQSAQRTGDARSTESSSSTLSHANQYRVQRAENVRQEASVYFVNSPLARLSPRWRLLTRRFRRVA